jgi:hypothetical protein
MNTDVAVTKDQRLRWSAWSRCESSFSLWLVPNLPGVFVAAEEVLAPGETAVLSEKRMLAVQTVAAAEDLSRALSRLFVADTPLRQRLQEGRCFIRYAVIADAGERQAVCAALENWLAGAEAAPRARAAAAASGAAPPLPHGF